MMFVAAGTTTAPIATTSRSPQAQDQAGEGPAAGAGAAAAWPPTSVETEAEGDGGPGPRLAVFVKRDLQALVGANYLVPLARARGCPVLLLVCDFVMARERSGDTLRAHMALERDVFFDSVEAVYEAAGDEGLTAVAEHPVVVGTGACNAAVLPPAPRGGRGQAGQGCMSPRPARAAPCHFLTFAQLARLHRCALWEVGSEGQSANSGACLERLRAFSPDFALNLRNNMIYKPPIISIPRVAFLNLHSGRIPAYRGLYALWRAMDAGDAQAACVLHLIDAGIDTGAVIKTVPVPVNFSRSFLGNSVRLYLGGIDAVLDALDHYTATGALPEGEAAAAAMGPGGKEKVVEAPEARLGKCDGAGNYFTVPTEAELRQSAVPLSCSADLQEVLTQARVVVRRVRGSDVTLVTLPPLERTPGQETTAEPE